MKQRPVQILIVAFIVFLDPLMSVVVNGLYFKVGFMTLLQRAWYNQTWDERAIFFLLGPILAASIFAVKRWSVPVSLTCVAAAVTENLVQWHRYPKLVSLTYVSLICVAQLAIIFYILLPQVRRFYFDRKVRWWENKPRYVLSTTGSVALSNATFQASILNISEGGVFLATEHELQIGDSLKINVAQINPDLMLKGTVAHQASLFGKRGYGVQFELEPAHQKVVKNFVRELRNQKVPSSSEKRNLGRDISELWANLLKGQGFVPVMNSKPGSRFSAAAAPMETQAENSQVEPTAPTSIKANTKKSKTKAKAKARNRGSNKTNKAA